MSIKEQKNNIVFDPIDYWYSAHLREQKTGDLEGAIKDISLGINNHPNSNFLYINRGLLFFKVKKYNKAINDLSVYISNEKDKPIKKRNYINIYDVPFFESRFLKECCEIILELEHEQETQKILAKHNLVFSKRGKSYINFLIALSFSTKKFFEFSLDHLIEIRDLDPDFLEIDYFYLLEHLPKEMKHILNLCWEIL